MAVLGYVRVSTSKQTTDQQRDALEAFGCERIFEDIASGARDDRKGLAALLNYARSGDTVVVWRLDRLGRSLSHVVRTAEDLHKRGVLIRGLNDGVDYSTPTGRMIAGILASLAEYERALINERAQAAREAARARGKQVGRPRAISAEQLRAATAMRAAGESMSSICRTLGVRRSTLYKAFSESEVGDAASSSAATCSKAATAPASQ
jgi:DNA invertase Pin-like site-specific DNA recombinase